MKIKSNNIINTRNKLSKDITHYWVIIRRENIMGENQIRNYNLQEVMNQITDMSNKRVQVKLFIQAINMGYKNFNEFKNTTNYETIFKLSELNEQLVQLGIIPVLTNYQKYGKKKKNNKNTTEIFTSAKIRAMKKKIQFEINALTKKLEDFNNKAELEVEDSYSKLILAA